MVIYIWEIVKFEQKIEIPIWTESLKFGSAIRPARKFEMLRIAWVRGSQKRQDLTILPEDLRS